MKAKALILTGMLLLACAPLFAAFDAYLQIDGIKGESQDDRHKDWIEASSFSWGVTPRPSTAAATGKVEPHDFQITKLIDKASPVLQRAALTGTPIPHATLEVNGQRHLLEDVVIKSIHPTKASMADGSVRPAEVISFSFARCATHEAAGASNNLIKGEIKGDLKGEYLKGVYDKWQPNATALLGNTPGTIILQDLHFNGQHQAIIVVCRTGDQMLLPAVQRAFQSRQKLPQLTIRAKGKGQQPYLEYKFTDVTISNYSASSIPGFDQATLNFGKIDGPLTSFHDVSIK